jgi:hypothetical protein
LCITPETPNSDEICNGVDDDCDGQVDESDPHLGQACTDGGGECSARGTFICDTHADESLPKLICLIETPMEPQDEICNGRDDNCDGLADNLPDRDQACVLDDLRFPQCSEMGT